MKKILLTVNIICLAYTTLSKSAWAALPTTSRDQTLILGKVSDDPNKHYASLKPMAQYLATQLNSHGIKKGDVLLAKNNRQMIQYLKEGRIDIVTESVVSTALYEDQANVTPIARKWKNASSGYQSLIFVRKESNIESLRDLIGKRIALEDPGSTSAYFIPIAALRLRKIPITELPTLRSPAPPDAVGTYTTHNDKAISPLVYGGIVEAGALSSTDWIKKKRVPPEHKAHYKIIYRSEVWPRMIESTAGHISSDMRNKIKTLLLHSHKDPLAKSALNKYQKTSRFNALNKDDWAALKQAKKMLSTMTWNQ